MRWSRTLALLTVALVAAGFAGSVQAAARATQPSVISNRWSTNQGMLHLKAAKQNGGWRVIGGYEGSGGGQLRGRLFRDDGTWTLVGAYSDASGVGTFELEFFDSFCEFRGTFRARGGRSGLWNGVQDDDLQRQRCGLPRRNGPVRG